MQKSPFNVAAVACSACSDGADVKNQPIEDVTDAQARVTKGKLPRNIVITLGAVAAVAVGVLGYYYQTHSEAELQEQIEKQKAEKLKRNTAAPDSGANLDRTIRQQQEEAREEAERQKALAAKEPAAKAPVMTASDFVAGSPTASTAPLVKKNQEDDLFTSRIFKGGSKLQTRAPKTVADLTGGLVDPAQMRALQQASAANAGGLPSAGQEAPAVSSDRQFLNETVAMNTLRTGIAGKLPKCTVSRGFVIPAVFVGGLNSDKPGEFRATVSQDVYDTVDGTCMVIPAGSTLVGTYSPDISIGQERVLAAFIRMQLPNKKFVPLMGMQGADPNGYAGISGDVNSHFFKIFSGALVIGVLEQRFNNTATSTTAGPGGITTYGNTAGQVAAQTAQTILNRNQNIRPTITTQPGQRMLVQVKHDMVLEPYRE